MLALFVSPVTWYFFSTLRANTRVLGLRSSCAKPSSIKVARTKSRFGYGLPLIAQSQLCC